MAGQNASDLWNEIADKAAVWYHIGLSDDSARVEVAAQAYECYSSAVSDTDYDTMEGYARETITLTRSGYPMHKYSKYTDMGHIYGPCYADENLFSWMFNHSLDYRYTVECFFHIGSSDLWKLIQ